ncbi:calcium/sodium antiporter [Methanococcoides orientis]|uniref:calcium/sodium antiporter n=1 Tax=Methanococcoides orientis TaxID=2822137 RepID=UPI001E29022D|nr:calcium/sodium antiporter [Methanococcoides orientis]UGV41528.1 calcium/sodium antiporter [Methanococcoides orientis]
MYELLILLIGLAGLMLGAELIIKAALAIAEHYKISHAFIGLTLLTLGTNLPELVISVTGSIQRSMGTETSGLIIGDSIGSCFGQIGITMGIVGMFGALTLTKRELSRDGVMMLISVALLFLTGLDGTLSRTDGLIFLAAYAVYFFLLYREEEVHQKFKSAPPLYFTRTILSISAGFAILILSSYAVLNNALYLADMWGISQSFIGIVLIGLGTSLPELALSWSSIRKRAVNLSVFNLIGSNIFDILFTLGVGSLISSFTVSEALVRFDIPALFFVSLLVLLFFRRHMQLKKNEAFVLILLYVLYISVKIYSL